MDDIQTGKKNMILYSVMIYVVFLALFAITGVISTFITSNKIVLQICVTVCSWTSFFVLMFMFKRLMPGEKRWDFIKGLFAEKINWKLIGIIIAVQLILFLAAVGYVAVRNRTAFWELLCFSPFSLVSGFFIQLVGGPLGEEPAYRGFALPYMQKRYSTIKAGIITGTVWGMWHLPLWIISGYKGLALLIYCVTFMVAIVSASVVMSVIYKNRKNIIYAVLIHQMVNFTLDVLYTGDLLQIFIPFAALYFMAAVVICVLNTEERNTIQGGDCADE
ncbi:MAG: type II CAAX endopeptidase family protein [Eubacteriales bacterium]|nr:type II CAAX endopeptidase family protein [Eubacteriales bacterium]